MTLLAELDAAAAGTVVVFGSLPPESRDLDLVVRPADEAALTAWLVGAGFTANGRTWARFGNGGVEAVEVVPIGRWHLAPAAAAALFADATPLPGYTHLARPAPHHALLLLARRLARAGELDERRRARVQAAAAEDPAAWDRAAAEATGWQADAALALLRSSAQVQPGRRGRVRALGGEFGGGVEGTLRAWRTVVAPPRRPGVVVALSGLDGSGKTTQVEALIAALDVLGVEAVREWSRLSFNPRLWRLGRAGKRALGWVAARRRSSTERAPVDVDPSRVDDPVRRLRYESDVLTWAWSTLVAVENGWAHRRQTRAHVRAGRVVVCDRYLLDSTVHLRYRYGESRRFRFQRLVLRLLSPAPAAAFFLDVPAAVAGARKADQYDVGQLERQVRLYREECEHWGARRLDGERPPDELAALIGVTVWGALSGRRPSRRR